MKKKNFLHHPTTQLQLIFQEKSSLDFFNQKMCVPNTASALACVADVFFRNFLKHKLPIWRNIPHMTSFAMPSFAMPSLPSPDAPFCKCNDPNCPAGPLMRKMNEMPTDGHNKISIRYQWCVLVQGTDRMCLDRHAKECHLNVVTYVRTLTTRSTRVRFV